MGDQKAERRSIEENRIFCRREGGEMVHKCEGSRSVLEERNNGVEGNIRFESRR